MAFCVEHIVDRRMYAEIVEAARRTDGRHVVIYADLRTAGRFVAGAVKANEDGVIEGFTLKVWTANL